MRNYFCISVAAYGLEGWQLLVNFCDWRLRCIFRLVGIGVLWDVSSKKYTVHEIQIMQNQIHLYHCNEQFFV